VNTRKAVYASGRDPREYPRICGVSGGMFFPATLIMKVCVEYGCSKSGYAGGPRISHGNDSCLKPELTGFAKYSGVTIDRGDIYIPFLIS
jgi:hypothetical protein